MTRAKRNTPPDTTSPRVLRGGSWNDDGASWVRAASRNTGGPALCDDSGVGFRCALRGRQPR